MVAVVLSYIKQLLPKKVIITSQNLKELEILYNKEINKLRYGR
jgi:pyridoxal/pyridoxine/pyridoxamine kinase